MFISTRFHLAQAKKFKRELIPPWPDETARPTFKQVRRAFRLGFHCLRG